MKKVFIPLIVLLMSQTLMAQIPSYIPLTGLEAWYPFDSSAYDSTGNGNNGVLVGDATYGTDRFGNPNSCYLGDGASAVNITVNHFPTGDSARTVSAWFKGVLPWPGGDREIFAWGGNSSFGDRFALDDKDTALGFEGDYPGVEFNIVHDSVWHNLVVAYPPSGGGSDSIKIYYDGVPMTVFNVVRTVTSFHTDTGYIHYVGAVLLGWDASFVGSIDDIGVWKRELKPCEVRQVFSGAVDSPAIAANRDTLTASSGYATYQWSLGGTAIVGATNAIYITPDTGNYTVFVTDTAGCSGQNSFDNHALSVPSIPQALSNFTISPNPAVNELKIIANVAQPYSITITNNVGQIVKKLHGSKLVETIDVSKFPAGLYLVSITDDKGGTTPKHVVVTH